MVDKPDMDEQLAQLDREWRRKYEKRDEQWRRAFKEFPEKMHKEIARVVGEGVASVVRDIKTADKIARAIAAGFVRLRAIDDLRTACGVDKRGYGAIIAGVEAGLVGRRLVAGPELTDQRPLPPRRQNEPLRIQPCGQPFGGSDIVPDRLLIGRGRGSGGGDGVAAEDFAALEVD